MTDRKSPKSSIPIPSLRQPSSVVGSPSQQEPGNGFQHGSSSSSTSSSGAATAASSYSYSSYGTTISTSTASNSSHLNGIGINLNLNLNSNNNNNNNNNNMNINNSSSFNLSTSPTSWSGNVGTKRYFLGDKDAESTADESLYSEFLKREPEFASFKNARIPFQYSREIVNREHMPVSSRHDPTEGWQRVKDDPRELSYEAWVSQMTSLTLLRKEEVKSKQAQP